MSQKPAGSLDPVGPLVGIAGSPGVAIATALVIEAGTGRVPRRNIAADEIAGELDRFSEAVNDAQDQIAEVHTRVSQKLPAEHLKILEAYQMMLADPSLGDSVRFEIKEKCRNAEWAVEVAIQRLVREFDMMDEPYLRERRHDVEFVGDRIQRSLAALHPSVRSLYIDIGTGRRKRSGLTVSVAEPTIVVAHDLSPADTAAMVREPIVGFATEVGTRTSHTAIMARALEIPAVVGVSGLLENVRTGDLVIVDGLRGEVHIRPSSEHAERAQVRAARHMSRAAQLRARSHQPTTMACGTRITLQANVEMLSEAELALDHGAEGIGLYRTEFLYIGRRDLPTEDEQFEHYRTIVQVMGRRPVTLRTFDLGGDKLASSLNVVHEANPALGVRAVRLALRMPEVFLAQMKAMARTAVYGQVRVMIPMVSSLTELRAVRALFARALRELERDRVPHGDVHLGVMVEVPSAAVCADLFAREAAFFSIGTNDLVQYTLAADRAQHGLAQLASHFDPAVLRLVHMAVRAARGNNLPVSVCGAMASDPLSACLLIGMGLRELSMEAAAIAEIKETLRRVTLEECELVARHAMQASTATEAELSVAEVLAPRLSDVLAMEESWSLPPSPVSVL